MNSISNGVVASLETTTVMDWIVLSVNRTLIRSGNVFAMGEIEAALVVVDQSCAIVAHVSNGGESWIVHTAPTHAIDAPLGCDHVCSVAVTAPTCCQIDFD
jgi:hypothetical protein